MLSLPIPVVDTKFLHIVVHFRSPMRKPIKYSFKLPDSTTIQDIINRVSKVVLIPPHLLVPAHIVKHSIYQLITLNKQITNINLTDVIILYEAPSWSLLARPQRDIFEMPLGVRIGSSFDIKDRINRKWYHGKVVALCHASLWKESMRNPVYIEYEKQRAAKLTLKNSGDIEADHGDGGDGDDDGGDRKDVEAEPVAKGDGDEEMKGDDEEEPENSKRRKFKDLRSEWRMKIHFVGWDAVWDEWIDCDDDLRIAGPGKYCADVPSEVFCCDLSVSL